MNVPSKESVLRAVKELSGQGEDFYFSASSISYTIANDRTKRPNDAEVRGVLETLVGEGLVVRAVIPSGNRFGKTGEDLLRYSKTVYRANQEGEKR